MSEFKAGELFVYVNGDRWELGMVKRENNSGDGYFCWYHRGDTAANTPTRCMHKLANAGWTHIEQQMDDLRADFQASEHVINQIANAGFDANAENEKLRELLGESLMDYKLYAKKYGLPPYLSDVNEHLDARLRELGIKVPE